MRDEVRKLLIEHGLNCIKSNELDKVAEVLVDAGLKRDAAKEFVTALVPFLSPYALHALNASLLRATIGDLKTKEFLRNDSIIKLLVLEEMRQQKAIPTMQKLTAILATKPETLYREIKCVPLIMAHVRDIIIPQLATLYPNEDQKNQVRALHIVMFNFISLLCQEVSQRYDNVKLNQAEIEAMMVFEGRRKAVVMAFDSHNKGKLSEVASTFLQEFIEALALPDNPPLVQLSAQDLDRHGRQFLSTISGDQTIQINMFKQKPKVMLDENQKNAWQDLLQTLKIAHQNVMEIHASDYSQVQSATMLGLAYSHLSWAVTAVVGMSEDAERKRQISIAHQTMTDVTANLEKLLELSSDKFNMAMFQEVMKPIDDAMVVLQSNYTKKSPAMEALNNAFADVKTAVDKANRESPVARL